MARHRIDIAAFEFVTDVDGIEYTYDINTNTNYNVDAEADAGGNCGFAAQAALFAAELNRHYPAPAVPVLGGRR